MSRIQKLENIYKEELKKSDIKQISDFIQSVVDADITKGKYARFLIESFLNDKFLEEDLIGGLESTVGQAISLFHKHKSKLPEDMRSVFKYSSPGDLWNSVKQFQGELSGKELKKEEQEQIYRETEFIYKDKNTGFQIISPLTEQSAKWWGKGTRWCTSAEKDNRFEHYTKDAPLFILLMSDKQKLQLWNNIYKNKENRWLNDIQFMDESDNTVSLDYIEQNWTVLKPICLWLNDLRFIPEHLRTKELCELAVKQNGRALDYVPARYKTKEFCELAVSHNGYALKYVPNTFFKKYKDYNICKLALEQNGLFLEYVPEKLKTPEICEIAVKQNLWALGYVPEKLKTKELCELTVKQNGIALKYIPEELKTKELCELAVKSNGVTLANVPEYLKTEELCKLAVKQDGLALKYVPDEYRTKELCELAVQSNGEALYYVSKKQLTYELCKMAVQQNGFALNLIPKEYKEEFCEIAVRQNGYVLQCVPEKYKTKEICELAIKQNGKALSFVPDNLKTPEVCQMAVQQDGNTLRFVPNGFKTELQHYVKDKILELPIEKYQEIFREIKALFPTKDVSLSYHYL